MSFLKIMSSSNDCLPKLESANVYKTSVPTIKRARPCQRRKLLKITPLPLDEVQRKIEEAEANVDRTWETIFELEKDEEVAQNKATHQDSFHLNFDTPAKRATEKFVSTLPNYRSLKSSKELNFELVTPKNTNPPKVQCSVKVQRYNETPIQKLIASASKEKPKRLELDFRKIYVNGDTYIVLNELGKGGSSEVFHAFNPETKTHRAIKVVSLQNEASAVGFINEVKMLRNLQKCNRIIKMFDFEIKEQEKLLLVVLEIGGTDLSKILKESALSNAHMPLYMLLYYWMEMLYSVKQIHTNGIIHSDLKPANFLKVEGYLKLIDFGIAISIQNDMTSVVKTVPEGSFNYISPEALSNETSKNTESPSYGKAKYKISYKSDVWSLGCILYQLVYRRTPFQHITHIWMKLSTIVNPKHEIEYPEANWVPQKIIETIKKCLQFNMKLRPSVDELISEYESMFQSLT